MRLLLFAAALLLQTPAPTATTPTLPTGQWILDMQAKNLDDILSLYMPDAVFVDPQGKQFATPDAMRKLYTDTFATYDSDLKRGKGTIAIQGNPQVPGAIAIEAAAYTEDLTKHADHTITHVCGDYRFTYILQQNGKWLIQRMEWTSKPCPAAN